MENLKENTQEIQEKLKDVIDSNVAYYKLWFFKVATKSATMLLKVLLIAVFLMMVMLFFSVALALFLGQLFHNNILGFLIVGGIYLVFMGLAFLIKDKVIEGSILEKFSKVFFND